MDARAYDPLERQGSEEDFSLLHFTDDKPTEFEDWIRDSYQTEEVYVVGEPFMIGRS